MEEIYVKTSNGPLKISANLIETYDYGKLFYYHGRLILTTLTNFEIKDMRLADFTKPVWSGDITIDYSYFAQSLVEEQIP